jgi:hypothetical protein
LNNIHRVVAAVGRQLSHDQGAPLNVGEKAI